MLLLLFVDQMSEPATRPLPYRLWGGPGPTGHRLSPASPDVSVMVNISGTVSGIVQQPANNLTGLPQPTSSFTKPPVSNSAQPPAPVNAQCVHNKDVLVVLATPHFIRPDFTRSVSNCSFEVIGCWGLPCTSGPRHCDSSDRSKTLRPSVNRGSP
jgi:hypothetical protein